MERTDIHTRLPADLHAALAAEAERRGVSLNALIAIVLTEWRDQLSSNGQGEPDASQ